MDIIPKPHVVTRVFMLFKGVVEVAEWSNAAARASKDVSWWQTLVGVDLDRALDPRLYRVLEWGGMEVIP